MSDQPRDPRAELVARAIAAGLTNEAATRAAGLTKLAADPTDADLDAGIERIIAEAAPEDFEPGHAKRFLHDLREKLLKERQAEPDRLKALDERLGEAAGSSASELDRRIGLLRRT